MLEAHHQHYIQDILPNKSNSNILLSNSSIHFDLGKNI